MKLILAVDAIVPPLTGIGRYTWELAQYYSKDDSALDDVRFYFSSRWVADPSTLLESGASKARHRLPKFLRPPAGVRRWVQRQSARNHVFHSPNYFLPEMVERGIVTVHDLSVFKHPETHPIERLRHFERGFTSTLRRADHLITDSEATRLEVAEYFGWSVDKISAIRLGVPSNFRPYEHEELVDTLRQFDLAPGQYSLCISTLEPRKRIDRLLEAYAALDPSLRQRYPLVLGGGKGWLNEAINQQIARGEREGWLRYLGFIPELALPKLYAGARAFFYPSLYEGFGLPVLEALASGVPTLTSNRSSLPEVADGAAWLVEPDDHAALCEGIEKTLCDETWRAVAITRGLEVAQEASWEQCAQRTLEVCRRFG
ncbi:glycosyltransferase family 4 protein [Paraburkholderia sediminicola]|uniref:glycosyltransferase family 4 protein n=1 Tax=Paraburkholderia sediminicola TaxID=458836 RepID=UPI0038BD3460